ncbi:LysR family transcriptional regulator [Neobacillus sp. D3-1R]|uniref:LysR family transcriptional regulator n=1 Tax=Neobacillus sp. D3-1R TaxID=3445778 RepID=UPI003F9FA2AC
MNQLKYFVSAVEAGSLTTAAKNLFISQPALSKQLMQLEEELGCQLFVRKTTGLSVTEAGEHFYQRASTIIKELEQIMIEMRTFSEKNVLRIGTLPSIGSYLIPSLVPKLNQTHKIELTIKDTTLELVEMLTSDRIDFAFVQDATPPKNILVETLFKEPYDLILPIHSQSKDKDEILLSDFLKDPLILHKHPCDIREFFEKYCKKNGLDFSVAMELEFNDSILPFVSNGVGSSILPRMVSRQIKDPSVIVKSLNDESFGRSIDFLYKPSIKKIANQIYQFVNEMK